MCNACTQQIKIKVLNFHYTTLLFRGTGHHVFGSCSWKSYNVYLILRYLFSFCLQKNPVRFSFVTPIINDKIHQKGWKRSAQANCTIKTLPENSIKERGQNKTSFFCLATHTCYLHVIPFPHCGLNWIMHKLVVLLHDPGMLTALLLSLMKYVDVNTLTHWTYTLLNIL